MRAACEPSLSKLLVVSSSPANDANGILNIVRDLGSVQLDPISAVARTQYLVLWSRIGHYDPAELDRLIYQERSLFEY